MKARHRPGITIMEKISTELLAVMLREEAEMHRIHHTLPGEYLRSGRLMRAAADRLEQLHDAVATAGTRT